ncbi:M56 family metallopeptidase [Aquimarina litoralis]
MEAFLFYLLKSSIILSLFYAVYFFLLRKDTFFSANRHFLIAGVLGAILLPFLEFTQIKFIEQPNFHFIEYSNDTPAQVAATSSILDWWSVLLVIYLVTTSILLVRFAIQLFSLRKILNKSRNCQDEGFSFVKTKEDIAPFSFFKYIIFNPLLHDSKELEMILKHEKIHAAQYHSIDILLINLFVIFQWMNPLSWLYKKSLQQNLEFIADQEATRDLSSIKDYQLTLVKVSATNYSSITNNFYQSLIKKRIVMLNKKESNHRNLWKTTIILPLLSLFLWSFNTKTEIRYIDQADTPEEVISSDVNISSASDITKEEKELEFPKKEEVPTPSEKKYPAKNSLTKQQVNTVQKTKKPKINSQNNKIVESQVSKIKKKNTIEFVINKTSTKEELERVKRILKNEYDVKVSFSDIERNSGNEITSISIEVTSSKSNANFSVSDDKPINPLVLSYDSKEEKINIGQSGNKNIWISKDGKSKHVDIQSIEIQSDDEGQSYFIINEESKHKLSKKKGENSFIIKSNDDEDGIHFHSDSHETTFKFDGNSKKKPLYYIDGKKASQKDVKKLKSDDIATVEVLKGKKSIEKYGKKAEDGVIQITTKKYAKKNYKKETGLDIHIDNDDIRFGSTDDGKKPIIFINGKKANQSLLGSLNKNKIKSVNVYKGEKALKKFGVEAENGVVEIITK